MRAGRRGEAWERAVLIRAVIKPCQEEEATPLSTSLTDTDGLLTRRLYTTNRHASANHVHARAIGYEVR